MLKSMLAFWKENHIRRFLCLLFFVFACSVLTGCSEPDSGDENASMMDELVEDCWTCSFFTASFEAIIGAAENIVQTTAASVIPFLAICTALWMALHILKMVSSMKEMDSNAFFKGLAIQFFWLALAAGLLTDLKSGSSSSVIELVIKPIFSGFIDIGLIIVGALPGEGQLSCPTGDPESGMVCLVGGLQKKLSIGMDIGWKGVIFSFNPFMKIAGLTLVFISFIMAVYFPMLLLDCVFRYGMIICLLPLFVCAYCFKATRPFVGKGMTCLVEIGLAAVGMCLFASMSTSVLNEFTLEFRGLKIAAAYLAGNPEEADKLLQSPGVMGVIFISFFLLVFGGVMMDIMKNFGGMGGIGKSVDGAKDAVNNARKTVTNVAKFAHNLRAGKKDKAAKEALKDADAEIKAIATNSEYSPEMKKKKQMAAEKRRTQALDRLEDRGYLSRTDKKSARDNEDGQLRETRAFQDLGKTGWRQQMKEVAQAWNGSGTAERESSENKTASGRHKESDFVNYKDLDV